MNIWQRLAIEKSSDVVQEAVKELQDELKTLRKENADLKSDLEAAELKRSDATKPK